MQLLGALVIVALVVLIGPFPDRRSARPARSIDSRRPPAGGARGVAGVIIGARVGGAATSAPPRQLTYTALVVVVTLAAGMGVLIARAAVARTYRQANLETLPHS